MTMIKVEVINKLNNYIETLMGLKRIGFSCDKEINVALKELHESMGFEAIGNTKSKNKNNGNTVIDDFKKLVEEGNPEQRLTVVNESHRGIGKTCALIDASVNYNYPILVKTKVNKSSMQFKSNSKVNCYRVGDILGRSFVEALVDDSLSIEDIMALKEQGIKIRGGFYYNNNLM